MPLISFVPLSTVESRILRAAAIVDAKMERTMASNNKDIRRHAVAEVDNARVGFPYIRAVVIAGSGVFMDAYNFFSVDFITTMIGLAAYSSHAIPSHAGTAIKLSANQNWLRSPLDSLWQ